MITEQIVNSGYNDVCSMVKTEMIKKLPSKQIRVRYGNCNKTRRVRKPWWNEHLNLTV